jgi:hypothetical protein
VIHQPPAWVLDGADRLALDGFQKAFADAWRGLERRFVKIECWQSYQEAEGVRSQAAFQAGDVARARELLAEEARGDQPLYDDIKARGLDFTRIRLIDPPLTDYLRYELINYEIRAALGEHIEFLLPPSPVTDYFDFVLFDSVVALVHDYGPGPVGRQTGGWLVRAPGALDGLAALLDDLRARSRPAPGAGAQRD